jgi:hypothetical protein
MPDFNMVGNLPTLISIGYPSNLDNKINFFFSKIYPNIVTSLSHSNSPHIVLILLLKALALINSIKLEGELQPTL